MYLNLEWAEPRKIIPGQKNKSYHHRVAFSPQIKALGYPKDDNHSSRTTLILQASLFLIRHLNIDMALLLIDEAFQVGAARGCCGIGRPLAHAADPVWK